MGITRHRIRQISSAGWPLLIGVTILLVSRVLVTPPVCPQQAPVSTGTATWQLYFSPQGGCTQAIVNAIGGAKKSIHVQAYTFTSAPIAQALVAAHRRGVQVEVLLDRSQRTERYASADFLIHAGIPTAIDAAHAIAHNKVIIIDGRQVITGSFNFTRAAEERNAENLLILTDPALAARYQEQWQAHWVHSELYHGK